MIHDALDWLNNNQGVTSALSAIASVLLTAIYVIATIILVQITVRGTRIAQQSLETIEKFERERARPYVNVALVNQPLGIIQLLVENLGETAAYNIRIKTDPEIKIIEGGRNVDPPREYERPYTIITEGLAFLPPKGRELSIIAMSNERFHTIYPTERFEGSVMYTDTQSYQYDHRILIDLSWQKDLGFYTPPDTAEEVKSLREEVETLSKILERKLK